MKNIVLIGFMGTGKSAVGEELAKLLKMRFVSTDNIIEQREKRPIVEIFEKSGEPYFRKVEKAVVKEVSGLDNVVIAAGGGAVLDDENMANLKRYDVMICLTTNPKVIYERTKDYKHRPLLNVDNPVEKIKQLLESRALFYAKADHQIDTSDKSVAETAKKVLEIINA